MQQGLNVLVDTFAKRLAHARGKAGLTQGQLSIRSGVAQSDISKIENGQILRPTSTVALAKALKCSPYWLDDGSTDDAALGWPFPGIDPARFESLTPDQRIEIQGAVRNMIQAFEGDSGNALRNGTAG